MNSEYIIIFEGEGSELDKLDNPRGEGISKKLYEHLEESDWEVKEYNSFEGVGWSFVCMKNDARVLLLVSSVDALNEWMVQISPETNGYKPGFIAKLLGKKPGSDSAQPIDVYQLSILVYDSIKKLGFSPKL